MALVWQLSVLGLSQSDVVAGYPRSTRSALMAFLRPAGWKAGFSCWTSCSGRRAGCPPGRVSESDAAARVPDGQGARRARRGGRLFRRERRPRPLRTVAFVSGMITRAGCRWLGLQSRVSLRLSSASSSRTRASAAMRASCSALARFRSSSNVTMCWPVAGSCHVSSPCSHRMKRSRTAL